MNERRISDQFDPEEIETLVRTAAEAVWGDLDDLSKHQRDLTRKAYDTMQQDESTPSVVSDEQAEAVRQAIIARYRWWFEGDHDLSPMGSPEDLTIQRDEDGHALISWEEGPDDWAHQVSEGGSTEEERVLFAEASEEFGTTVKPDEPAPVTFPDDVRVEPYSSYAVGVYPE